MSDIYPCLALELDGGRLLGALTRTDLEFEARHPNLDLEPTLRITRLLPTSRGKASAMFVDRLWSMLFDAGAVVTQPSEAMHTVLLHSTRSAHAATFHRYFILDQLRRLHAVEAAELPNAIKAWEAPLHDEDSFGPFLVELAATPAATDLDTLLAKFRHALRPLVINVGPVPPMKTEAHIGAVVIADAPTPEQRATARREAILDQARAEAWPESDTVGRLLGSATPAAGRQRATRLRASGELLGLWSPGEKTYYHPRVQFLPDGRVHPQWQEFLSALATVPHMTPGDDPNGWGRYSWLTTPRGSLSERDLAEAASPDGIAPNEATLSRMPRTPLEVFASDPAAVITWVRAQAEAARDRR